MAFNRVTLTSSAWTLIGNGVTAISFQNAGSRPIYVNVTAANSPPTDTVGLIYRPFFGEMKKTVADMTLVSGTYVWARSASGSGAVIVET